MNPVTRRRLAGAFALSVILHLLAIIPMRLPGSDDSREALQPHLRASISTAPQKQIAPRPTPPKPQPSLGERATMPKHASPEKSNDSRQKPEPETQQQEPETPPAEARILDQPQPPEYPRSALASGQEACVLASVLVNVNGEVDEVTIIATDHPGVFNQSVIESQKSARYAPAHRNGRPVPSRTLTVASFVINPGTQLDCPLKYAAEAEKRLGSNSQ